MQKSKKGFTLIEMLAVIAIIAVLVAIIVPAVSNSTQKAEAAVDAANLRNVLGMLNTELAVTSTDVALTVESLEQIESKCFESAEIQILYTSPGFIKIFYVSGSSYYSLDYFSALAEGRSVDGISTAKPADAGTWYKAGSSTPLN